MNFYSLIKKEEKFAFELAKIDMIKPIENKNSLISDSEADTTIDSAIGRLKMRRMFSSS